MDLILHEDGNRTFGTARVLDESVFEIQFDDIDRQGGGAQSLRDLPLLVAEVDKDQLAAAAPHAIAHQSRARRKFRRRSREVENHLANGFLEDVGRTVGSQHSVDQDADAVSDPLDVPQDVRAEQNRASLALNDLDHRFEEIAADDRIKPQGRVIQNQEFGVGRRPGLTIPAPADRWRAAAAWLCERARNDRGCVRAGRRSKCDRRRE